MDPLSSPTPVTFYVAWRLGSCGPDIHTTDSFGRSFEPAAKAEMSLLETTGLLNRLDSRSPASSCSVYQKPASGCVGLARFSSLAVQL